MNVTPRFREDTGGADGWRILCGICGHAFYKALSRKARMVAQCPNCTSYNVWNEPVPETAPSAEAAAPADA